MVLRAGRLALVVVVAATLAKVALDNAGALAHVHLHLHGGWLVLAVPFSLVSGLLLALGWRALLGAWGAALGRAAAMRIWWRAQASRYIPTGMVAVASREVLSAKEGVPRSLGAASNVVELVIGVAWGGVVAGALLPSSVLPLAARALVGAGALVVLGALPWVLRTGGRVLPRRLLARLPALADTGLEPAALYRAIGLYGVSIGAKSVAFALVAAALTRAHPGDVPLLMGTVQGASVIGIFGITPAGIGVREGIMVVLLGARFGVGDALALAVAWRAWELAFELSWLGGGLLMGLRRPGSTGAGGGERAGGDSGSDGGERAGGRINARATRTRFR